MTNFVTKIERALQLRLADRRFWLISALGLFMTLSLTLILQRADVADKLQLTMQFLARMMLVVECTLLCTALLLAWDVALPRAGGWPTTDARRVAAGLSGGLMLFIQLAVQLLPLLALHRYPDLAEQSIHVPLMLLQRGLIILLAVLIAYHLLLGLLLQLRTSLALAGPAFLALYAWATFSVTKLSLKDEHWQRLNDVFYWNELWNHLPDFPKLQTDRVIHNIEQPWLGYYLTLFALAALASLLLWLPAAAIRDRRETIS